MEGLYPSDINVLFKSKEYPAYFPVIQMFFTKQPYLKETFKGTLPLL
jgi:hypothetical protein